MASSFDERLEAIALDYIESVIKTKKRMFDMKAAMEYPELVDTDFGYVNRQTGELVSRRKNARG